MIDSGCTLHVTYDNKNLICYHDFPILTKARTVGKSMTIDILGHDIMVLYVLVDGAHQNLFLRNVLYVPLALHRFIAPRVSIEKGYKIIMDNSTMTLYQKKISGSCLFIANYNYFTTLYRLDAQIINQSGDSKQATIILSTSVIKPLSGYDLWH